MENLYRAPQSNLRRSTAEGITPVLAEILASGSFWARMISVVNVISLCVSVLYLLALVFGFSAAFHNGAGGGQGKSAMYAVIIIAAVYMLPALLICWFYASSMHRYAKAAKALRQGGSEDEAVQCFAAGNTFLKTTGIVMLICVLFMLLGIAAAVLLPAYQDYVFRSRLGA